MKFTLEIELPEHQQSYAQISATLSNVREYMREYRGKHEELEPGDNAPVTDINGNTVGKWEVREDATDAREAIKCPKCKSGELQCVRDASVTRSVVGAVIQEINSRIPGGPPYRFAEAELSDDKDVNEYDDYRLCCNECDETFSDDEVYDIVFPAEAAS